MKSIDQKILDGQLSVDDSSLQIPLIINVLDIQRDAKKAMECKSYGQALREMFKVSDFDRIEDLAEKMGMDKARFSRVLNKPDAQFTEHQMNDYMRLTGSVIAPLYSLRRMGLDPFSVRLKKSALEQKIDSQQEEIESLKTTLRTVLSEARA